MTFLTFEVINVVSVVAIIIKYLIIYIFFRSQDDKLLYSPGLVNDSIIQNIHSIWITSGVILAVLFTLFVWPLLLLFVV